MQLRILREKLPVLILLLIGLTFFQVAISYILPLILPTDNFDVFIPLASNAHWIGNIIFGLAISRLARKMGPIAINIGILSIVLPTYGSIFYMLTILRNSSEYD